MDGFYGRSGPAANFFAQRQAQGENQAAVRAVFDGDTAALGLGEALDQREAEAGPARGGVGGALKFVE